MEKMKMQSENLVDENVGKIAKLFPNCITEGKDENGNVIKAVDFDMLKQELSKVVVEGNDERYMLNWAGKKQAILTANAPISKTLRPVIEDEDKEDGNKKKTPTGCDSNGQPYFSSGSVGKNGTNGGFDSENLYIEGDNLDVLKLLRETYLNKIKMIYIDPPYNTGNDFVYNDNFKKDISTEEKLSNYRDEDGNIMWNEFFKQNPASNGRFHSDWLSMMYPRLKLAKDLLTDDGAIFISIDDNEQANLKKICDEIFGAGNFICNIPRMTSAQRPSQEKYVSIQHDYILIYVKQNNENNKFARIIKRTGLENVKSDEIGLYFEGDTSPILASSTQGYSKGGDYDFEYKGVVYKPIANDGSRRRWLWTIDRMKAAAELGILIPTKNGLRVKNYINKEFQTKTNIMVDKDSNLILASYDFINSKYANNHGTSVLNSMDIKFDFSKPVELLIELIKLSGSKNCIVLDFFSGSATTAHAVMQLNAEDGGNRKFIMVQLPEKCDEKSEAYKAGYKNICEIGKERIRRAGKKIVEEIKNASITFGKNRKDVKEMSVDERKSFDKAINMASEKLNQEDGLKNLEDFMKQADKTIPDIGFRVLKLDSSNMKDVYYSPSDTEQTNLLDLVSNIKEDRSPEDLLFQVMLDMGVMLDSKIEKIELSKSKQAFNVNDGNLICCFDINLSEEDVTKIAKMQPLYAVFRDSSMSSDSIAVNFDQIFETYSPSTTRKVL